MHSVTDGPDPEQTDAAGDDASAAGPVGEPESPASGAAPLARATSAARGFVHRHERKLWWLHSTYALGLGISVVFFAARGFDYARWLMLFLLGLWLLLVVFFRIHAKGSEGRPQTGAKHRLRFFAMTYVLKNLYQGMLFFLLPFYWEATSLDSANRWFLVMLGLAAILSTFDLFFDRLLMRYKTVAGAFYAFALFAAANLSLAAFFPGARPRTTLLGAAALAVLGFWSLHIPLRELRQPRLAAALVIAVTLAVSGAWLARKAIPAVPMYVGAGAVGPRLLPDGRLALEVSRLHTSEVLNLYAVTDVWLAKGRGERLAHAWRHNGQVIEVVPVDVYPQEGERRSLRLRSFLSGSSLPESFAGEWSVDVVTEDDQLVGRVRFAVVQ